MVSTWYFRRGPYTFYQLFTIMGSNIQKYKGEERKISLPFVCALLENKREIAYHKVLQVAIPSAEIAAILIRDPPKIMPLSWR